MKEKAYQPTVSAKEVDQIARNLLHDPFIILGPHRLEGKNGWVVRAWIPDARAASVLHPTARSEFPMHPVHSDHFFEVQIPDWDQLPNYQLHIIAENGHERFVHDPYFFLPQLGELDLYLFGKGDHHTIYEKLGSHPTTIDGVNGVYFAVWRRTPQRQCGRRFQSVARRQASNAGARPVGHLGAVRSLRSGGRKI